MARLALLPLAMLFLFAPFTVNAQIASNSLTMQVYGDGSAAIVQTLSVNASAISITVPLLSSIITNVFAIDQNGNPLSFQISGNNITVYTVGATGVTIRYDTDALTSKQGTVWTLEFATSYNLTVILPPKSTLSSVSGTPISLSEQNGSPVVVVSPGKWTISYGVPIEASATSTSATPAQSSSPTSETTNLNISTQQSSSYSTKGASFQYTDLVTAIAAVAALTVYLFLRRRSNQIRESHSTELRPDDVQVLDFISEKGGKVFEQEIRARFTLPKTSAWRQIKRLERLGYVKVYKTGSQNQIELLKKRE